jgi:ADP-ribose pyrophosphatase YjhB (NUDIX family)
MFREFASALLRRKDNDKWTMPCGTLDLGESLTHCAIRGRFRDLPVVSLIAS